MILLTPCWPERHLPWALNEKESAHFCATQGRFITVQASSSAVETVVFQRQGEQVEIINYLRSQPCYIDGRALRYEEANLTGVGAMIQIGRYGIALENDATGESLNHLLDLSEDSLGDTRIPELDVILQNSILHVMAEPEGEASDVLKILEKEFRQALIWGVQPPQTHRSKPVAANRFAERMFNFDAVQAQVQSTTVTHCIFESNTLIDKVFSELNISEQDVFSQEDTERCDVLRLLASEEMHYDMKKRIPDLLLKEIYQADLDTQL